MHGPVYDSQMTRLRLRVSGRVQGVGFRPHVFTLAKNLALSGWVKNDKQGVLIEVQGEDLSDFIWKLKHNKPPLCQIDLIKAENIQPIPSEASFSIHKSLDGSGQALATSIVADASLCNACLRELFDPEDRHYRYPFLTCTHCGPRYTITKGLPYDRPQTSLSDFPMCEDCSREYHNPLDRRFHAEPIACPVCGPRLSMSVREIAERICSGEILAVKGLGGFHLVCDAYDEKAVQKLRLRKNREAKPFALMALNEASLTGLVETNEHTLSVLKSHFAPIVLMPRLASSRTTSGVAPGMKWLGVMYPYVPLHYLIFFELAGRPQGWNWLSQYQDKVLVMTSANPGGEPLVIGNDEAGKRLKGIADVIVTHNRDILVRCDDSVVKVVDDPQYKKSVIQYIRRARGYIPEPIKLSRKFPPLLAVGAHLKNTICLVRGDEAFVSQYLGDMENSATYDFFEETIFHLKNILEVEPELIAHDLHPDFLSTAYAKKSKLPTVAVQHHVAHVASVMAENRMEQACLGLALDGFGMGSDGQAWGGELLLLEGMNAGWQRLGHLRPIPLPGGDRAAQQPWRMAASVLFELGREEEILKRFGGKPEIEVMIQMMQKDLNSPLTSSLGRLFDAAAGLLGVKLDGEYESQAAMLLESLVDKPKAYNNSWLIDEENLELNFLPLFEKLIHCEAKEGAEWFHGTLIKAIYEWAKMPSERTGIDKVVLSGGCLLNQVLVEGLLRESLEDGKIKFLLPKQLPPGDGAISLGQAWMAGLSLG